MQVNPDFFFFYEVSFEMEFHATKERFYFLFELVAKPITSHVVCVCLKGKSQNVPMEALILGAVVFHCACQYRLATE